MTGELDKRIRAAQRKVEILERRKAALSAARKRKLPIQEADIRLFVAERVRQLRRASELTQGELSDLVGISRTSIANIETARQGVTMETLVKLSVALGVRPSNFLP